MYPYIHIFGIHIPAYGTLIACGLVVANIIAAANLNKETECHEDLIVIEAYAVLGAFIGAKLIYLIVSFKEINWKELANYSYFNSIMQSGFVFYGGLIGGVAAAFIGGKVHKINTVHYLSKNIYLVPLCHAFGRIGCFMAGCCYGIAYEGFGSVVFPKGAFAPAGIRLFPIQLLEAVLLFAISLLLYIYIKSGNKRSSVWIYGILYGIIRFFLEFFRGDYRGDTELLSLSQWISVLICLVSLHSLGKVRKSG